jgi:SEL1 protein
MGKYFYEHGDLLQASQYFEAAVQHGSPFEGYYYIAEIHAMNARGKIGGSSGALSITPAGSCAVATSFYKVVAERGCWGDELVRDGNMLWDGGEKGPGMGLPTLALAGTERGREEAIIRWLIAAEMGIEPAQNNVAFVLDQGKRCVYPQAISHQKMLSDKSSLRSLEHSQLAQLALKAQTAPPTLKRHFSTNSSRVALTYWTRSAAQRNVDAMVKIGDYHYYGIGLEGEESREDVQVRNEKAAGYYQTAVDTQLSALAMWNMGWMYENGVGVPQVRLNLDALMPS